MTAAGNKPTLRDVAKHAQVSLATASRAISRVGYVSEESRQKVQASLDALRYLPNRVARHLSRHRSETIGVIVPSVSNPLFSTILDGVRDVLDRHGYGMLINSAEREPARELEQVQTLVEHGVDAILTVMPVHDPALQSLLDHVNVPIVYVSSAGNEEVYPRVDCDNVGAMLATVRHVLEMGHRKVAVLSGSRAITPVVAQRLDTALEQLRAAGCEPVAGWVQESGYDPESMRKGARAILQLADRPTAIVCTGDTHAMAAIAEAHAMDLRVPEELSVTGCNDLPISRLCHPRLTTVQVGYYQIGEVACRIALDMCDGKPAPRSTILPTTFISRESVARLP